MAALRELLAKPLQGSADEGELKITRIAACRVTVRHVKRIKFNFVGPLVERMKAALPAARHGRTYCPSLLPLSCL